MDIEPKWRRTQKKTPWRNNLWILIIMAMLIILLFIILNFIANPVKSQSLADIEHVVLFMQVQGFPHTFETFLIKFLGKSSL
jgi:uncharacterized BrkB/YihY/UPF0761 family membrane protein